MTTQVQHLREQSRNQRTTIASLHAEISGLTQECDAALKRVAELIDIVDELTPLIGAQYDVPELRALADELTRKGGG